MSIRIDYDDDQINVIEKINKALTEGNVLVQFEGDEEEHDGFMLFSLVQTDKEIFSNNQIERFRAAFKCLELARAEGLHPDEGLISVACDYGMGIKLTREECEKLMAMRVSDLIHWDI